MKTYIYNNQISIQLEDGSPLYVKMKTYVLQASRLDVILPAIDNYKIAN